MVAGYTFTLPVLLEISKYSDNKIINKIRNNGINNSMEWRKALQRSLAHHNKSMDLGTQMQIVHITQTLERYCRPHIYKKHWVNIRLKYPEITEQKVKNLANDKTERTILKYSY